MSTSLAIPAFVGSFALTLAAALFFGRMLDRVGLRLGLPEAMLGLLAALATDAPEVSSALVALVKGDHKVAVGVVVGSNVFNLAAMVGVSAILVGSVTLVRESAAVEGFVALWTTGAISALVAGAIGARVAFALVAVVALPYVALLAVGKRHAPTEFLKRAFGEGHRADHPLRHGEQVLVPALVLAPALALIVFGSWGMVTTALELGDRWSVPHSIVAILVLAPLTSLPDAATGIRLGLQGRGSALVSETLNSNSINLVVGLAVPTLFVELGGLSRLDTFGLVWLAAMTVVMLGALAAGRAGRALGAVLVACYAVFAVVSAAYS